MTDTSPGVELRPGFDRGIERWLDAVHFVALLTTALALGAALAHLYALPNKIGLPREAYFVVQGIYRGWSNLAYVIAIQFVSILALVGLARHRPVLRSLSLAALLALLSAQAVFWLWTWPANEVTGNWTIAPENWETLRRQWEYSHAAGAALQLLAFLALVIAALVRRR